MLAMAPLGPCSVDIITNYLRMMSVLPLFIFEYPKYAKNLDTCIPLTKYPEKS